ncbi:putative RNA-dependent RNA polymerase SHL2 [Psilocybe cubensis]|uniref:RNA-dependent RNA polymerase n=2 Tax=Psilocybe cubensis TaxID=181762 RepID=A0A8H7Y0L2_PSICU|nr:putative RNA-dependent RNA polymerase SHL2 [Psilocybe cubensis]KAH9482728.1 putative RNA-dependent RNA polymerase SHL2 [Psilocybe cubensis]
MEASSSKMSGLQQMLEEDEMDNQGEGSVRLSYFNLVMLTEWHTACGEDEVIIPSLAFNKSTDSLGGLSQLSQQTSYSQFGENDITSLIMEYNEPEPPPPTQPNDEDNASGSSSGPSTTSLGKRKASESSSVSINAERESKIPRPVSRPSMDDFFSGGFEDIISPDDYTTPIRLSAHHSLQPLFRTLAYGSQYEIARYVSLGKAEYKTLLFPNLSKLAQYKTNALAVPVTARIILSDDVVGDEEEEGGEWKDAFAREQASKSPWAELDREEESLKKDPMSGLGFTNTGEYKNWYGGKVLFHGKLQAPKTAGNNPPRFKMTLEPAELDTSNMFARRFGSKNIFRLKLTKYVLNTKHTDALMNYLCRPLILCGSVFRAFYSKETNVFYIKTNEYTDGEKIITGKTVEGTMSLLEFLEWHNPMAYNNGQTMAKYVSRFALGLSNSVPGIVVNQSNIHFIDDIIASSTKSNMTDGAGKINRWSLMQIRHRLNWEDKPTAIQIRIFGTKGLLIDDGINASEEACVQVTPSQRKIQFPEGRPVDLAHRIVDVLRASHTKAPCRLSVETIICLAENGVPKSAFLALLQKALVELVEPLLKWDTVEDMRTLWTNVRRLGGVMAARRAREEAGLARVKGYSDRNVDEDPDDDEGIDNSPSDKESVAWWADEVSGCPSSLEETVMCMLDAGFTPQDNPVLRDKLYRFIKGRVGYYIKGYRIDVPMSATAFIVPDTYGILEPGEIFFKSSRRAFLNPDGSSTDVVVGKVLLTRHPCKLPTDIQKMDAVDRPGLHHLTDVIVMSTKGDRRAADLLSGGDYDGDKGTFIYQPELVEPFKNASLRYSEPPKNINKYFVAENMEVTTFQEQTSGLDDTEKIRRFQEYLLGSVRNMSVVGKYSTFHDISTYTQGYSHPDTIRLAYMFCMTLDGIKTGMRVLPDVLAQDMKNFNKRAPRWKETDEERTRLANLNEVHAKRPQHLSRFIMDDLYRQAEDEGKKWYPRLEKAFCERPVKIDEDLAAPWRLALEMATRWMKDESNSRMANDLERIKYHVEVVYNEHRGEMGSPKKPTKTPKKSSGSGSSFSELPIEVRQNKIRELSQKFNSRPTKDELFMAEEEIARLRASYAYVYDFEMRRGLNGFTRFPFDMAMRELCLIKSRAIGRMKAVTGDFYDHFNMKHPKQHHH